MHPTHYNGCDYLSMLGLKLNHVSKRGHWCFRKTKVSWSSVPGHQGRVIRFHPNTSEMLFCRLVHALCQYLIQCFDDVQYHKGAILMRVYTHIYSRRQSTLVLILWTNKGPEQHCLSQKSFDFSEYRCMMLSKRVRMTFLSPKLLKSQINTITGRQLLIFARYRNTLTEMTRHKLKYTCFQ